MNPATLIDPATGTIQLGVQKRFSTRMAASFDYGLKFDLLSLWRFQERKDYRYHKYKIELKYFFKTNTVSPAHSTYLSFQGFYFPQQYRKDNDLLSRNGKWYRFDHSNINRQAVAISLLAGKEVASGRWIIDYYVGVGIKRLFIRHQAVSLVDSFGPEGTKEWYGPVPADQREGSFYRPHLPSGVKIGYIIGK